MDFIDQQIQEYADHHSSPEPQLLQDLSRETMQKVLQPRMLSGHFQGRVLSMISHMLNPKCILEIGTYTAYATLCLSEGLAKDGVLHTIDINDELEVYIKKYIAQSDKKDQIHYHIGNALDLIPQLNIQPDLVFIDADKENYSAYLELLLPLMPVGSHIIADNVLWSGKILHEAKKNDKETKGLQDFNALVQSKENLEKVLLPIRDGLFLMRKTK